MKTMVLGALLFAAQASGAGSQATFLTCTLPDINGKPIVWGFKLNEEAGTVQVVRGGNGFNKVALFGPKSVTFKLFNAKIAISRVDGTIKQTPDGEGGPRAGKGRCTVSNVKRAF